MLPTQPPYLASQPFLQPILLEPLLLAHECWCWLFAVMHPDLLIKSSASSAAALYMAGHQIRKHSQRQLQGHHCDNIRFIDWKKYKLHFFRLLPATAKLQNIVRMS